MSLKVYLKICRIWRAKGYSITYRTVIISFVVTSPLLVYKSVDHQIKLNEIYIQIKPTCFVVNSRCHQVHVSILCRRMLSPNYALKLLVQSSLKIEWMNWNYFDSSVLVSKLFCFDTSFELVAYLAISSFRGLCISVWPIYCAIFIFVTCLLSSPLLPDSKIRCAHMKNAKTSFANFPSELISYSTIEVK
jgi:hypothetical protein